jgi:tetratricopeptide (TPR) repeat protein/transglutaminase-like putative cysteine protease
MRTVSVLARVALTAFSVTFAFPALAQRPARNPYDAEVARHAAAARREGSSPRAVLPILELEQQGDDATPGVVLRELSRLAQERRLSPVMRSYVRTLEAFGQIAAGRPDDAARMFDELGFLRKWRVIGAFDDEGKQGFARAYPPEEQRNAPVDENAAYPGREREVRWRLYPEELTRYGYVDFDATLRPYENACGYAETFVQVDRARPMGLFVGAGGAIKVWANGNEVLSDPVYRGPAIERSAATFHARQGWNRILVKVCVQDRRWGFYARLGEADGSAPRGVTVDPNGATEAAPAPAGAPVTAAAPVMPLAFLEERVRTQPDDAGAHFDLARFLAWTAAEDPTETRSRQLAERAVELRNTVEHALLAADLVETRAERMRYVSKAEEADARDPRARLARAELISEGPDPGRALRMLDEGFSLDTVSGIRAAWMRASLLEERDLPLAGFAIIEDAVRRTNGAARWQRRLARALANQGRTEASMAANRTLLEREHDAYDVRYALMGDAYERGENDVIFAHLDAMRTIAPGDTEMLEYAASVYEGLGRHDDALDLYRQIVAYAPDEPRHHQRYGTALLRLGQQGAAIEAFRQVLALSPQDAGTRQLLDRLQPTAREDERYATATEEILARRVSQSEWPVTMLHELQVATVYESGLAATFHQVAFQVHDDEGARRMARFPVFFEPGRQWVEVRSAKVHRANGSVVESVQTFEQSLGDSAYRIYYDTRALILDLPQLEPGDTVELRFRVEDVSRRNAFNDYYGAVRFLQGGYPTRHLEHVLVTPKTRRFYFNEPSLPGLRHTRATEGERHVDRWLATNVEPVRGEDGMPGPAETRPYLHVSTYQSWNDVGRWWWGLAQDQLLPDESLERTTRELVAGAADTREKVARIYDWVIRNTRYVGLEFGIHGFKPYRVTQIVRRGFGDCKDKASLIYAMLKIAGVEARIALIRTRRNGAIATEPASLAVFDHAIAYVPELDLFLDGTAETNGPDDLPAMDQGVMTLLVGPETVELRQTPVLPPDRERRERTLEITLEADGAGQIEGRETIVGNTAASYRTYYQAEGMQNERLQRELSNLFPGLELSSQRFFDLDDFRAPSRFEWQGRAPNVAQRSGTRLLVPPSTIGNLLPALARAPTRRHALELGPPRTYLEQRNVRLPAGATLEPLPSGGEVESPFAKLTVRYERQGDVVRVRTEWITRTDRVSVADYPAFRAFVERADALLRERITLGGR